ncbi:hypothetical protein sos41_12090 [Alphaproteobacteria bacterium SO-S41]|nr:hypothetical protein sos41_12090 [Alphaproteobacteria bacterium SO-S41]
MSDEWEKDEDGQLLVSMLTGFATGVAPDGSLAVLRIGFRSPSDDDEEGAVQLALRPEHIRELIETLTKLEAKMVEKATPAGSA